MASHGWAQKALVVGGGDRKTGRSSGCRPRKLQHRKSLWPLLEPVLVPCDSTRRPRSDGLGVVKCTHKAAEQTGGNGNQRVVLGSSRPRQVRCSLASTLVKAAAPPSKPTAQRHRRLLVWSMHFVPDSSIPNIKRIRSAATRQPAGPVAVVCSGMPRVSDKRASVRAPLQIPV